MSFSLKLGRFYNDEGILQHEEVCDLLNSMADENEQLVTKCNSLNDQIDELEDDNTKYHKSLEKLEDYNNRFIPTECPNEFKDCKTNRFYWLDWEGNFTGALELMNSLSCENEELKSEIRKQSKQCTESIQRFKEENEQLKQQFIMILNELGKHIPPCDFCEFGHFYTFSENHGTDVQHLFTCQKGHGDRVRYDYCSDWKITVERNREE